jgi:hypothetical protein
MPKKSQLPKKSRPYRFFKVMVQVEQITVGGDGHEEPEQIIEPREVAIFDGLSAKHKAKSFANGLDTVGRVLRDQSRQLYHLGS